MSSQRTLSALSERTPPACCTYRRARAAPASQWPECVPWFWFVRWRSPHAIGWAHARRARQFCAACAAAGYKHCLLLVSLAHNILLKWQWWLFSLDRDNWRDSWLILSLCFAFEVEAPGQCLKFHDRLVSARHKGWAPAKWSPLSPRTRPEWRSIKRVGQAPWPHTSSPLSPAKTYLMKLM